MDAIDDILHWHCSKSKSEMKAFITVNPSIIINSLILMRHMLDSVCEATFHGKVSL